MAVTYADLVAFGFAYVEDNVSANVKKPKLSVRRSSVPLLTSEDMCLCEEEDFIIFAEFSEVKGPVALFTVPSYIQHDEKIDINSFIMRIMSVDYQANPGGQFCICQDTQIVQTNVSRNRHAYVHYFTLYDLHARGFVRPLCVAYVSTNHHKLHRIFPQLREHFLKVTEAIKVNNRQHFRNEIKLLIFSLKTYCEDENTAEKSQEIDLSNITSKLSIHPGQCLHQYEDLKFMLTTVESALVGVEYTLAALDHWSNTLTYKDDDSPSPKELQDYLTLVSPASYLKHVNLSNSNCVVEKRLRPIPVLCPWGSAFALSLLLSALQTFGSCELSACMGYFPSLSSIQRNAKSLKQEEPNAWEALVKSDFLQLLQALAAGALEASTPSLDEQECYQTEGSSFKEGTSGNEGSSSYHSLSDSNSDAKDTVVRSDSVSSSFHVSTDLSPESILKRPQERSVFQDSFHTVNDNSVSPCQPPGSEDFHSIIDNCSSPQCSFNNNVSDENTDNSEVQYSSNSSSNGSESFHDILEVLHSDDNWSLGSTDENLPLGIPWNQCLWTRQKPITKSGHRLLKFFWTYRSAAQHIIYSLLMGRTLVLTGDASSERRVQRIMSALSPLIPPLDSNGLRVLRWHQGILVSAHIASYQLIGMCIPERLSIHDMISPRDKNSVTILDVNTEQLLGPAYHGHLLAPIGNNVRDFPSDHSLLLYMQSVLSGIGRKLQSYKALIAACSTELPSHACRQLDIQGCDADIIRYLSKISF